MLSQKRPTSGYGPRSHHQQREAGSPKSTSSCQSPSPVSSSKKQSSSSSKQTKRKYRTCCGGAHIPKDAEAGADGDDSSKVFPGQDTSEMTMQHNDHCDDPPMPTPSPRQDGGLFQMLLDDDADVQYSGVIDDGQDGSGGQFCGVESTYEDIPDEEQEPTPSKDTKHNSTPRKRSKKLRKTCEDPFAKLPPIYQNPPTSITQYNKEDRKVFHQRVKRKGASGKFGKQTYTDEPFKWLANVVFTSADVDKDNRLNRRELASILDAPSLDLDLLKDDIKVLEKECTNERQNLKRVPISFEEFLPLAECLLPLYYSKKDTDSRNQWCVLDRDKLGHLFFNKHTGEVSVDIPVDFFEEKESHLLEEALKEVFETADMNKDGQMQLQDFFRIINSADFGLLLTKRDVKELTKYFLNEVGKVRQIAYNEFIGLARRLIVTIYRARDSTPYEWCHLYTCQVGSFWFNKRTGQTQRYAPNFYVRMQQTALLHREHEMKVFSDTADELKETKAALEQEMAAREDFETKFHDLTAQHEKLTKAHESTVAILNTTKLENDKRQKLNDKLERENAKLQSKIKYLESRVSELERSEANLESLREVLRNCQTSVKERDYDINELKDKLSITNKALKDEQNKCTEMEFKIDDLHHQLRDEIKRNEKMEKELDKVPLLQQEMDKVNTKMQQTEANMEEKKAHLILARATHRNDKERIQTMEKELSRLPDAEKDLEMARCEVYTLKQLLVGKDKLVMRKSQELENVKEKLEDEDPGGGGRRMHRGLAARGSFTNGGVKVMKMDPGSPSSVRRHSSRQDAWACSSSSSSSGPPSIAGSSSTRASHKSSSRRSKSRLDVSTPPNGTVLPEPRPKSAPLPDENISQTNLSSMNTKNGGFLKLLYNNGTKEDMPTLYDLYTPDGSYSPVSRKPLTPSLQNGSLHSSSSSDKLDEADSSNKMRAGTLMFEDDFMAAQFIHVGDRVRLRKPGAKPGSCKTNDILTGTVKFVGKIDKEKTDHRLYVGMKLDDPVGDTDGEINGKRYFNAKSKHGKLVKIHDILSILNPKTASYKRVSEFVRERRLETGAIRYDKGPQLIRVI
ncbi:LOW QUALITY PROTEIN: uncharacterized protein [Amphiura filiformis]|uniref:LOW QUALITY PROTEIN: uncharacterized protein n=1 Tax=Amphiura filiformis TaxID=82378 RepID=UPI003B20EA35